MQLNDMMLDGRSLRVTEAQERPPAGGGADGGGGLSGGGGGSQPAVFKDILELHVAYPRACPSSASVRRPARKKAQNFGTLALIAGLFRKIASHRRAKRGKWARQ